MFRRLGQLIGATRPMFLTASALPVLAGSVWGARLSGSPHLTIAALALAGVVCLHAGANVLNDVSDEWNGCDRANHDRIGPFTGGSRMIQNGIVGPSAMLVLSAVLMLMGTLAGLVLAVQTGWMVIGFGLAGGALGIAYSLPPLALVSRGLGELAVATAFGLPVMACAWLQGASLSPAIIWVALAMGGWTAAILIMNEVPDRTADDSVGKRTLAVRLGPHRTAWLYALVQAVASVFATAAAWSMGFSAWTALPPLGLVAAGGMAAWRMGGDRAALTSAIHTTLAVHLLGGLWLIVLAVQ